MPIAYLIQSRGKGTHTPRCVYHLHLSGAPYSLCGNATEGRKWRSIADLAAFLNTPEGLFVRTKRMCALCAALQKPYLDVAAANARVEARAVQFDPPTCPPDDWSPGSPNFNPLAVKRHLRPDEPCGHPGYLSHVSHPCEGCGRVAGRLPDAQAAYEATLPEVQEGNA
jgi:hypothetical protein